MVDLSKFTSNKKKILSGVLALVYNQVCCQTLIILNLKNLGWSQTWLQYGAAPEWKH